MFESVKIRGKKVCYSLFILQVALIIRGLFISVSIISFAVQVNKPNLSIRSIGDELKVFFRHTYSAPLIFEVSLFVVIWLNLSTANNMEPLLMSSLGPLLYI